MEKLSTLIFLVFISLAMLGYLYYGRLLFQTLLSGTGLGTTIEFAIRFILWLLPLIGLLLFALLFAMELLREKRK